MNRNKITSRQKEIILNIVKNPMATPITISEIANNLQISTRTVLREMKEIEEWLEKNDFELIKKPGVGIILNETLENKKFLLELIEEENVVKEYSKEERKIFILSSLLTDVEAKKSSYFTKILKISDGTFNNDLNEIGEWLSYSDIKLVRKPGIGLFLKGNEKSFRQAQIKLIHQFYNDKEILDMVKNIGNNIRPSSTIQISSKNRLLNLIDKSIIKSVEDILANTIKSLNMNISDSAYIGLIVHISLAIQRLKNGETITIKKEVLDELRCFEQFLIAKKIVNNIESEFNIDIPEDEIGYITMHLKGAKLRTSCVGKTFQIDNVELLSITKKIIRLASEEFNISLENDDRLVYDLTNHLAPAICRINMNMDIRNPILKEIKRDYADIYLKTKNIIKPIEDILTNNKLPESEIGYLTMHFESAIQRNLMNYTGINVMLSCPTGIGTSRFVSTKIKEKFPNLQIKGNISSIKLDKKYLKENNIDLIISTVKLDPDIKHVCINTMLTNEDEKLINLAILDIAKDKIANKKVSNYEQNIGNYLDENLFTVMNVSTTISRLLEDFKIITNTNLKDIDELIRFSSRLYSKSSEDALNISKSLKSRVDISLPYIEDIDICLLHCCTNGIDSIKMAVINCSDEVVLGKNEKTKNIIFMLLPKNAKEYERNILSEINQNIIDNEYFINSIKLVDKKSIENEIKNITMKYLKNQINLYIKNKNEKGMENVIS